MAPIRCQDLPFPLLAAWIAASPAMTRLLQRREGEGQHVRSPNKSIARVEHLIEICHEPYGCSDIGQHASLREFLGIQDHSVGVDHE